MTITTHPNPWRIAGWSLLAALLVVPGVAMRFTTEVDWDLSDFIAAGILLGALGLGFELVARMPSSNRVRVAAALALVGAFLLIWAELAVGIFT